MSSQQFRNVCFTLNNYTEEELDHLRHAVDDGDSVTRYLVLGFEVGEGGTPHVQGYAEFSTVLGLAGAKKALGSRIHIEPRRGTQQQAVDYCQKDGKFEIYGSPKSMGRPRTNDPVTANRALSFLARIRDGERLCDLLFDPDASFAIIKHLQVAAPYLESARDFNSDPPKVTWFYGPTGTGKTRRAIHECVQEFGVERVYIKSDSGTWFDGYDGHDAVVFDDFRSSWFEFSFLLKLLDRYPHRVQVKGSSRQWKPKVIYITAPHRPQDTYRAMQESDVFDTIQQLLRRITHVEEMAGLTPWAPPPSLPPLPPPEDPEGL